MKRSILGNLLYAPDPATVAAPGGGTAVAEPVNPGAAMKSFQASFGQAMATEVPDPPASAPAAASQAAPAAPATTTAPVTKPDDDDDGDKWPRDAKDWKAFKAKRKEKEDLISRERDAIKSEKEALSKEIEALRKAGPSPELDALKKERDELSQRLELAALERHPQFERHFNQRTTEQIEVAKSAVGANHAAQIELLLKLPESPYREQELEKLMGGLTVLQQGRLAAVVNNLTAINTEKTSYLANASEKFKALTASEKAAAEARQKETVTTYQKAFESVVAKTGDAKEGMYIFQKRNGDDQPTKDWNARVDKTIETAKNLVFGRHSPEVLSESALRAAAFPDILGYALEQAKLVQERDAQIAALKSSNPTVSGDKLPNGETRQAEIKPGTNPFEATRQWAKGLTQLAADATAGR